MAVTPQSCGPEADVPSWDGGDTPQGCNAGVMGNRQHWLLVCNFLPFGCKCCPKEWLILGVKPSGQGWQLFAALLMSTRILEANLSEKWM